jgi:CHAT domain-containing protein/Tfp pilus assembly protein PilF
MAGGDQDSQDLFIQANQAYLGGNIGQALEVLDQALVVAPEGDPIMTFLLVQKVGWLRESGHPEESAKALAEVTRELEQLSAAGNETQWSSVRMEQGMAAHKRGDFTGAEALLAEAADLAKQSPARDLILTDVFANQASLYLDQGRLSDAQNALHAALEIDHRVGNKRSESNDLNMLGMVYKSLGDRDTAQVYLRNAFEVAYQAGLPGEAADAMANLANLMDDAGDHAGAAEIFRQIGQFRAEGGDESGEACSVANQGVAASLAGDQERAAMLLARSHELHLATGNTLHAVQDQLNLSSVETSRGNLAEALSYAEKALAAAREFGLVELLWATEYMVASCRVSLATDAGSEPAGVQVFEEALAGYRRAADVVELLRSKIDRPEERESLLTGKDMIYDSAISLCLALQRAKDAFQFSERARMRSFLEALGESRVQQLEGEDAETHRRDDVVTRLLSPLTPADEKPRLMDELRTLRAEIAARRPALAAITEAELPGEDDIRAAIPDQTYVLEFFQLGNTVISFLLDREGLKDCAAVSFDEPVEVIVQRFRDEIDGGDPDLATGNTLFASLLRPVMKNLATTANLIVVPHRSLHYVPFSALWFVPAGDDAPPRQYLKTRFYLTAIPSASYLPRLTRLAAADRELGPAVVLGNPTGNLPGAETEALRVAARLAVTAKLGKEATRQALLGAAAPAILHVASHGTYNDQDPLLSGLELSDGVVTVEDLLSSGPAPGLLVLSGCVTGMSARKPGEELTGLAQAALRNGTRSVVATLWETFDESSTIFFEHFYEALTQGHPVSEAVGWARESLATGPAGYDQPGDWAPFLLIGDPDQRLVEPDQAPLAIFNRGLELADQGDEEAAKAAFHSAMDSSFPEMRGRAAYALGLMLSNGGDVEGALEAWQTSAASGDTDVAPMAEWSLASLLEGKDDIDGAQAAYQRAIDSNHPDAAPRSLLDLGGILVGQGDIDGALVAYRRAMDTGHPEAAPRSAMNLGMLLAQRGDIDGAKAAYRRAIDSGDQEMAPRAAEALGTMLAQGADTTGARVALQTAVDSGHPEVMPWAAYNLGVLLARQQDFNGARAALRLAAQSRNAEAAREAAELMTRLPGPG